jgi:hypothetical protein
MISKQNRFSYYEAMKSNGRVSYKSYLIFKKFTSNLMFRYYTDLHNCQVSSTMDLEKYMNI